MQAILFLITTLLAIFLFYKGTGSHKGILVGCLLWAVWVGIIAATGFFQHTAAALPRMMLLVNLPAIAGIIILYRSLAKKTVHRNMLLAVHVLRIPVEITLYLLFLEKKVPVIMTFEGWNYDIVIGITAAVLLLYPSLSGKQVHPLLFRIWNILGLIFLANIVGIAILSAPSPIQHLAFDQPNIAILGFPYTLLPGVVVPLVILSHLLCLRANTNLYIPV